MKSSKAVLEYFNKLEKDIGVPFKREVYNAGTETFSKNKVQIPVGLIHDLRDELVLDEIESTVCLSEVLGQHTVYLKRNKSTLIYTVKYGSTVSTFNDYISALKVYMLSVQQQTITALMDA